jgi:hypothetical protein
MADENDRGDYKAGLFVVGLLVMTGISWKTLVNGPSGSELSIGPKSVPAGVVVDDKKALAFSFGFAGRTVTIDTNGKVTTAFTAEIPLGRLSLTGSVQGGSFVTGIAMPIPRMPWLRMGVGVRFEEEKPPTLPHSLVRPRSIPSLTEDFPVGKRWNSVMPRLTSVTE